MFNVSLQRLEINFYSIDPYRTKYRSRNYKRIPITAAAVGNRNNQISIASFIFIFINYYCFSASKDYIIKLLNLPKSHHVHYFRLVARTAVNSNNEGSRTIEAFGTFFRDALPFEGKTWLKYQFVRAEKLRHRKTHHSLRLTFINNSEPA